MTVTLLAVFGLSGRVAKTDQTPMILEEVRRLGQLRTVSQRVNQVYDYETHRTPEGWAAHVPLVQEVVAATTSNRVLVRAVADVEAGVDLSRARVVREGGGTTIILPEAEVYEPVVKMQVFDQKDGLFWRDLNIGGKAESAFAERSVAGCVKDGILVTARENAANQLREVLKPLTNEPIAVRFEVKNR